VTRAELDALLARRFAVISEGNLDRILDLFIPVPVYELPVIGRKLVGREGLRAYYAHFGANFMPRVGYEMLGAHYGPSEVAFEILLKYRAESGAVENFHTFAVQQVQGDRFVGERLYASERCYRLMFGGCWDLLETL
jgi:hypothetical protein